MIGYGLKGGGGGGVVSNLAELVKWTRNAFASNLLHGNYTLDNQLEQHQLDAPAAAP